MWGKGGGVARQKAAVLGCVGAQVAHQLQGGNAGQAGRVAGQATCRGRTSASVCGSADRRAQQQAMHLEAGVSSVLRHHQRHRPCEGRMECAEGGQFVLSDAHVSASIGAGGRVAGGARLDSGIDLARSPPRPGLLTLKDGAVEAEQQSYGGAGDHLHRSHRPSACGHLYILGNHSGRCGRAQQPRGSAGRVEGRVTSDGGAWQAYRQSVDSEAATAGSDRCLEPVCMRSPDPASTAFSRQLPEWPCGRLDALCRTRHSSPGALRHPRPAFG